MTYASPAVLRPASVTLSVMARVVGRPVQREPGACGPFRSEPADAGPEAA
jgi:hypothetical protein